MYDFMLKFVNAGAPGSSHGIGRSEQQEGDKYCTALAGTGLSTVTSVGKSCLTTRLQYAD